MKIRVESLDRCGIPEYMHGAIVRFYENGIRPGSFLEAVIDNDLREACACADETNRRALFNYVQWFYSHAPSGTWGFAGAVDGYIKAFHEQNEQEPSPV